MGHRALVKAGKKLRKLDLGPGQPPLGYVVVNAVYFERFEKELARSESGLKRGTMHDDDQPAQQGWRPTYTNSRPTERLHRGVQDALKQYTKDLPSGFQYDVFVRTTPADMVTREYEAVLLLSHDGVPAVVEVSYRWDKTPPVHGVVDAVLYVLRGWETP